MLKLTFTFAAGLVPFFLAWVTTGAAFADDFDSRYQYTGRWHSKNLPHQKPDTASLSNTRVDKQYPQPGEREFNLLDTEADLLRTVNPFSAQKWKSGIWRSTMLGSLLRDNAVIGMNTLRLQELIGKPLLTRDINSNRIELFWVASTNDQEFRLEDRPFLLLEVRSNNQNIYGYRLVIHRGKALSSKGFISKMTEKEFEPSEKAKTSPSASALTLEEWKRDVKFSMELAAQYNSFEQRIAAANRGITVYFEVSKEGKISNVTISDSSRDAKLDKMVLDTISEFSGSKLLRIPNLVKDRFASFSINFSFPEYCDGSSVEHFLHGHCDVLNGVDVKPKITRPLLKGPEDGP